MSAQPAKPDSRVRIYNLADQLIQASLLLPYKSLTPDDVQRLQEAEVLLACGLKCLDAVTLDPER